MDRISGLPDELLIKILLFLPTKVAVSTSLLSKRWEFLWMWLSKLKFDVRCFTVSEGKRLQCFLDKNLPLHRAPVFKSLCLKLRHPHFKPEDVKLCVLTAVSRIIHELNISYDSDPQGSNILPSNLYSCTSLVSLKLRGNILLDVPRFVCLVSLKTLHLNEVTYFNDGSFQRLLSICPVLKHLSLERCKVDNMGKKFSVISRSLESLSIEIPYGHHLDGYVIDTPSLEHFKLIDYSYIDHYCLIENMPKLSEAHVEAGISDIKNVIRAITSVKCLTIYPKAMCGNGFVFNQLEHLTLYGGTKSMSHLLVQLLKESPRLRLLNLLTLHDIDVSFDFGNQPSTIPKILLSSLQTFKWSAYRGTPQERDLAVCILKNARQLKTITIIANYREVPIFQMIQELSLSLPASTMRQVVFL